MILAALALAAPGPLDDAGLDRKVDVWMRTATVSEAVQAVSRASGRPLLSSGVLQNQLVNVFIQDVPAREVLKALADTLDAQWQATSAGPLLAVPSDRRVRLQSYLAAVDAAAWDRIENSFGGATPGFGRRSEAESEPEPTRAGNRRASSAAGLRGSDNPAIRQLRQLWPTLRSNLRQFVGVVPKVQTEYDAESGSIRGTEVRRLEAPRLRSMTLMRVAPTLDAIEVRYLALNVDGRMQFAPPEGAGGEALVKHPFRVALSEWTATEPGSSLDRAVQLELEPSVETWADAQLEEVAKQNGLSIISDSYRVVSPKPRAASVGSLLGQYGYFRIQNDIVRLRFQDYWERQRELPSEVLLRRLEKQPTVSLKEYRNLLASLSPRARWRIARRPIAVTFATAPLQSAPAIWFLGALSPAERRELQSGPVAVPNLSTGSRRALDEALLEAAVQDLPADQVMELALRGTAGGTVGLTANGDATIAVGRARITLANPR